jgi:hypothetical protein
MEQSTYRWTAWGLVTTTWVYLVGEKPQVADQCPEHQQENQFVLITARQCALPFAVQLCEHCCQVSAARLV